MKEFRKLLKTLQRELTHQERLLELLVKERAAIVEMNQERIEAVNEKKAVLLEDAVNLQNEREALIQQLTSDAPEAPKFEALIESCPEIQVKRDLSAIGASLKETVSSVVEMNSHNSSLIKQALGIVGSTLAIFRSAPGTALPTYTGKGKLTSDTEDPAFGPRSRGLAREA
jgi:flagellar biosynthesis/type III secretory pathway chaperone